MHRLPRLCALAVLLAGCASAPSNPMSFFVTSTGSGKGADLGGLAGADAHCEKLAASVGAGGKGWRAYLSTTGATGVNARDRIGSGPWVNAKGVTIASDVASLHGSNNLSKQTALTEKGELINGRGDTPNTHDILTGSNPDGTLAVDSLDTTCGNWTSNATTGRGFVGHHDRQGGGVRPTSWNSAHPSRGCSQANLVATGGNGLFYCFAR